MNVKEPASWLYPKDPEPDFPFVDEELYYQTKDRLEEAETLMFQLVDELYDECVAIDRDIIHGLVEKLCDTLDIYKPEIKDLKIGRESHE